MNKDLEIIKWNTERLKGLVDEGERYAEEARNESNEAAERMAAEIEQFKKANSGLAETFGGLSNEIIYYKHEIARLKAELEKLQPIATSCNGNDENIRQITHLIKRAIIEGRENEECNLYWIQCWDLLREIKQLKAELEKRPEVVFCKDCRAMQKGDQIDPERLTCVHGAIVEPYDFCSMGQRRESEEGE